jgi:ribosome-associated protein
MNNKPAFHVNLDVEVDPMAKRCLEICEESKAADILMYDVRDNTILADYFIVCSGTSMPHIRAIADHIRKAMLQDGIRQRGSDGVPGNQWLVLDYGIMLIHIMAPELRHYYCLEDLWDKRKIIYRGGAPLPPPRPGVNLPTPPHQLKEFLMDVEGDEEADNATEEDNA